MESEAFDALFDRVRAAAFTDDVEQRGWEAVRTAALLRQHERYETALASSTTSSTTSATTR
jgi:hypothetical protein